MSQVWSESCMIWDNGTVEKTKSCELEPRNFQISTHFLQSVAIYEHV